MDLATPLMGVYRINTSLPSVTNRKAAPRRLSIYTAEDVSIYTGDLKSQYAHTVHQCQRHRPSFDTMLVTGNETIGGNGYRYLGPLYLYNFL